jgi:hypothetical protein
MRKVLGSIDYCRLQINQIAKAGLNSAGLPNVAV